MTPVGGAVSMGLAAAWRAREVGAAVDGAVGTTVGFHAVVEATPDRTAIVEPDGATLTFRQLAERVHRVSHALRAAGLRPGDCVVAMAPNGSVYHTLRLATAQTGLYFTPISHHLTPPEVAYVLDDCAAALIVVNAGLLEAVAPVVDASAIPPAARIVVGGVWDGWSTWDDWQRGHSTAPPDRLVAGEYMGYTSGTTGRPKAVRKPLPAGPPGLSAFIRRQMSRLGIEPGPFTHLVCGPLYHAAPGTLSTVALQLGHTVVITERPSPAEILELVVRHRVSVLFTVPTVLRRMLRLPAGVRAAADLSSLVSVVHAGAPCPPEVKAALIDWLGPVVYEFYGTTEGTATSVTSAEWLAHRGTVGRPLPGIALAILDEEGNRVPPGEVGTVYFTPPVRFEYLHAPEKTAAAMRGDLFTAGDLGHLDEDGWLHLVDRRTDLVISGGVNIYPAEVEAAVLEHGDVADVAVIGVPDPDWGQRLVAVIQPEAGIVADALFASDLERHCRQRLAGFKVPRELRFVAALPRSSTGKLRRRDVRDMIAGAGPGADAS